MQLPNLKVIARPLSNRRLFRSIQIAFFCSISLVSLSPATALCESVSEKTAIQPATENTGNSSHAFTSSMLDLFRNVCQHFGTKYRLGGQNSSGFDCSGFVRYMYDRVFNMQLPRTAREMSMIGNKVDKNELKPGDLVFFQTKGSQINHVGIFIGADTFIHSSLGKGITEDQLKQNYYDQRFAGAVRLLDPQEKIPSNSSPQAEKGKTTVKTS
jgi:cell wall-associated NlpC family hydrolase